MCVRIWRRICTRVKTLGIGLAEDLCGRKVLSVRVLRRSIRRFCAADCGRPFRLIPSIYTVENFLVG